MIKKPAILALLTTTTLLLGSCSANSGNGAERVDADKAASATSIGVRSSSESMLPTGFSMNALQDAFEEYVNYRLWFYPAKVVGNDSGFDALIGRTIDVEVRIYTDDEGVRRVYGHTSNSERLAIFAMKEGIVYCAGQAGKEEPQWPQGDYETIDTFSIEVGQPHKPNYGTSARKEKMIAAAEAYDKAFCQDMIRGEGAEEWQGSKVYLADFYEYEEAAISWIVRRDGYAWLAPVHLAEKNGEFETTGLKGFGIEKIYGLDPNDSGRYMFESLINGAAKQFTCGSEDS
ncbi:hypothetical protein D7Z26_22415 [Cohnella endophytica]|uniref:Uncharacterized protein n=1 Tax=Cohnella endophytica TaxID=2419778 RepID=A0A494XIP5_9BACL|nr:hypothetical protein [Cohnella endophytica]RKP47964.1 hypothetical protein D7Z26_22415 [Cohnella endophytica]